MRINTYYFLYTIIILTAILFSIIVCLPNNILLIIIGTPLVFLLSFFAFIPILYSQKNSLNLIERLALSLVLFVAVVPHLMVLMNFTQYGIYLIPVLITITIYSFFMRRFAWFRQWWLHDQEGSVTENPKPSFSKHLTSKKVISIIISRVVLGIIARAVYSLTRPEFQDKCSKFYFWGIVDKVEKYTTDIRLGASAMVNSNIRDY